MHSAILSTPSTASSTSSKVSPAFDEILQIPVVKTGKSTNTMPSLPKAITGEKFREILIERQKRKDDEQKAKEARKKQREEKKKAKEDEKLRKQKEREEKKLLRKQKQKRSSKKVAKTEGMVKFQRVTLFYRFYDSLSCDFPSRLPYY
ncbi:putative uncharacterized protein DDB_G0271982 [Ostrea edulis]|uniref:putative uncharacterized protein DDB_G0271982 n=1 Tax=Ostrea edulis TaxID=37623 RepID=UPI0024AF335E|nr:putative uncharacterized protein DDB_G0271982 [Ostrea edulis]